MTEEQNYPQKPQNPNTVESIIANKGNASSFTEIISLFSLGLSQIL